MKRYILSCPTLRLELEALLPKSDPDTQVIYLPTNLHSSPPQLRAYLQATIDHLPEDTQQILLCVSGCGGGTSRLKATTGQLVIPKTRDCIDILLSQQTLATLDRDSQGIFLTASWMESFRNSSLDLNTLTEAIGEEAARERLKLIYQGFTHFYIIDTGTYDLAPVVAYIQPLVTLLDGTLTILPGHYGLLHKLLSGDLDQDFQVIPKGGVSL